LSRAYQPVVGIIGGSGLYDIDGLERKALAAHRIRRGAMPPTNCWKAGSAACAACFLPRHGRGHRLSPTHLNYRANIDALKRAAAPS